MIYHKHGVTKTYHYHLAHYYFQNTKFETTILVNINYYGLKIRFLLESTRAILLDEQQLSYSYTFII